MSCEQCYRKTDYLFQGTVVSKATRYSRGPKPKPLGIVDVMRDGQVCQRCRPPSNLEIQELLEEGTYKGQTLEVRSA